MKAKELRRFAEPAIAWAVSVSSCRKSRRSAPEERIRIVHAMRMAQRTVKARRHSTSSLTTWGPATQAAMAAICALCRRASVMAMPPMAVIELVDRPAPEAAESK